VFGNDGTCPLLSEEEEEDEFEFDMLLEGEE